MILKRISIFFLLTGLLIFSLPVGKALSSSLSDESVQIIKLSADGYDRANSVTFSPNGAHLAIGTSRGISIYDTKSLLQEQFISTNNWARSVVFAPDGQTIAAGMFDNTVRLWNLSDGLPLKVFIGHTNWVRSIAYSPDSNFIASASDDNTVRLWNVQDGSIRLLLEKDVNGVRTIALSPDGHILAAGLSDNTVSLWRTSDGTLIRTLSAHTDWVRSLAFSQDGKLLASGSFDKTIRLWNVSDGKLLRTFEGHTSSVLGIAFSPNGLSLASVSVDTTVRLWRVTDGKVLHVLRGHSDFVYSIAFSPDGRELASGSQDNTVRIWDLEALNAFTDATSASTQKAEEETHLAGSDCRKCHHRRGNIEPPRVIELSCESCHPSGISQSWCTAFPRSDLAVSTPILYHPVHEQSGVPVGDDRIGIVIASPGNGETLYIRGNFMAPELISGKVFYTDQKSISGIKVQLDILSDDQIITTLVTHPSENGEFNFNVAINPESPPPQLSKPGTRQCLICHGDFTPEAGLPHGDVRLVVTATTLDGKRAFDERWIRVDSSGETSLPIRVIDNETGEPVQGLPIQAFTILYHWRNRFDSVISGFDGISQLELEKLSQARTVYDLSIPPTVLNGKLYSSQESAQVVLSPTNGSYPAVTLLVKANTGQITGSLINLDQAGSLEGMNIWAIQLPTGPAFKASVTSQGAFSFNNIPISQYLILPDSFILVQNGYSAIEQNINLISSPQENISISVIRAHSLFGTVFEQDQKTSLPFAWIKDGKNTNAYAVDPVSGQYLISEIPTDSPSVTMIAPGYYSQNQLIIPGQDMLDFQLVPRPETRFITWGNGKITIPPETDASLDGLNIRLKYGWLWGQGDSPQSLVIDLPVQKILISSGRFALEVPKDGIGWFYLYDGKGQVTGIEKNELVEIEPGQMIALKDGALPIPMEGAVASALHPPLNDAPIPEIIQPSLGAQIQYWLTKAGIGVAQVVTFITYTLSLVALLFIPYYVVFLRKKIGKNDSHIKEKA